jgi:hypothetical protein
MNFEFEWYDRESGAPTVSLAEYGLMFNRSAIEVLGCPARIALGFDKKKFVVAVKPIEFATKEFPENRTFPFAERIKDGDFARINNKDFIRYVGQHLPHPIKKAMRCIARWDEQDGVLLIDLKQHIGEGDGKEEPWISPH